MRYIKMYFACAKTSLAQVAAYRADFIMGSVITLLSNILFPLVTILIYANGASFPDWNIWEVLLIQSIYSLSSGIASMVFCSVLWVTMNLVRDGSFETVLLKPVSPLFFIMAANFDVGSFGIVLGAVIMMIIALCNTGIIGIGGILSAIVLFFAGLMVTSGMNLIMAAISFKWVGNSRIPQIFNSISTFGMYPVLIFPKIVQVVTAFVIPVAVIGFFPASALLGRLDTRAFLSILPCGVFLMFGVWLYNKMIRLYEGVGG